jgi:hypothetical protein
VRKTGSRSISEAYNRLHRDAAVNALKATLQPIPFGKPDWARDGELALQKLIHLVIEDAHQRNPQPLPVVVILHGDKTGMPLDELNPLIDDFLGTSGIVFGIKDSRVPDWPPLRNGEVGQIFRYMTTETGGQYFSVSPSRYGTALEDIIVQSHFRYELGFKPLAPDGKRHRLKVELGARDRYRGVRLRYRAEYIPSVGDLQVRK